MYIALDCETGGLNGESLLEVYYLVLDATFKGVGSLHLKLKPNDGIYQTTAQALSVNKIDLVEHDKSAITCSEGGEKLVQFLKLHSSDGKNKLIPLGHNVTFDLICTYNHLVKKPTQQKYMSYRTRDTGVVAGFLKDAGLLPSEKITGSLKSLADHFGLGHSEAHTAKGDVLTTVAVYISLID